MQNRHDLIDRLMPLLWERGVQEVQGILDGVVRDDPERAARWYVMARLMLHGGAGREQSIRGGLASMGKAPVAVFNKALALLAASAVSVPPLEEPEGSAATPEAEQPEAEHPVAEQPEAEHPVVEQPEVEHPVVEQPEVEHPVVEQPEVEHPVVLENLPVVRLNHFLALVARRRAGNPPADGPVYRGAELANLNRFQERLRCYRRHPRVQSQPEKVAGPSWQVAAGSVEPSVVVQRLQRLAERFTSVGKRGT